MSKRTIAAAPAPDDRPDRDLFDDPDLIEFTQRLPEARKVSIKVMNPASGSWKHKGSMLIDAFNLDAVQKRFGGGSYQFSIHGADGKLLKTVSNIEIDDLPEDEREPEPAKTTALAVTANSEMQMIREQMREDRLLMMELIKSLRQPQQSDIVQLVNALHVMKQMEPKHEPTPQIQDLLLKSFTSGLEVAQKINKTGGSDSSPLGEVFGFVREIFNDARPIIQSAINNAIPPQPNAPTVAGGRTIPVEGEDMDETEIDLKPALQFVKDQLRGGMPPNMLAHLVLGQMQSNPDLDETLSALIVDEPIESFLDMDPELKEEPIRTTFGKFFGEMRARILQAGDTRGDSGNPADAGNHASVDAGGR